PAVEAVPGALGDEVEDADPAAAGDPMGRRGCARERRDHRGTSLHEVGTRIAGSRRRGEVIGVGGAARLWHAVRLESILQHYTSQGYTLWPVRSYPKGPMVRLRIDKLMARRGISAYALSRGAQLSYPSA